MNYIISALIGFAYGCLFCWFNHRILMKAVAKTDPEMQHQKAAADVVKAYIIRYIVSLLSLVLVIFICKIVPLHFLTTIIAAAIGLTLPSQIWHVRHDTSNGKVWHNSGDSVEKWNDKDAAKEAEDEKAANEGWQAWEDWDKWEEPKSKEKISSDSDDLQKKEE